MRIRRSSVIVLVGAVLFVPGLAACEPGGVKTAASQSPATSTDPKQALLASTLEIAKGNFSFVMKGESLAGEGVVHLPSNSARVKLTTGDAGSSALAMDMVYIGSDSWVKIKGEGLESVPGLGQLATGKYHHLDKTKIKGIAALDFDFQNVDPAGAAALTQAVVDVQKSGVDLFTGNIDLTKATDSRLAEQSVIKNLGAQATKLPFEAKVDQQGRLVQLTIKVPAVGQNAAQDLQVTYADYGSATAPTAPPASEVVETPAPVYDLLK
ncbi:hypothetical protein AB0J90_32475 [Micromonospora sp. NPDC049523]|uniref:hypothetical protein n=1 Tax=Micromonospora sp. NPDC049523 TaxID=3155921 RepID=UPI003448D90B